MTTGLKKLYRCNSNTPIIPLPRSIDCESDVEAHERTDYNRCQEKGCHDDHQTSLISARYDICRGADGEIRHGKCKVADGNEVEAEISLKMNFV